MVRYDGCRRARRTGLKAAEFQLLQACAIRNLQMYVERQYKRTQEAQRAHLSPEALGRAGRAGGAVRSLTLRLHRLLRHMTRVLDTTARWWWVAHARKTPVFGPSGARTHKTGCSPRPLPPRCPPDERKKSHVCVTFVSSRIIRDTRPPISKRSPAWGQARRLRSQELDGRYQQSLKNRGYDSQRGACQRKKSLHM